MAETIEREGIKYSKTNGRMCYHPEFHENHGKRWTEEEKIYVCSMWGTKPVADIALAVARTHSTVATKVGTLKKSGLFEMYRNFKE